MKAKTVVVKKEFDAVEFMRKRRNKISKDISNMDFDQIKKYFSEKEQKTKP